MTIEIQRKETEDLIRQHMDSGGFQDVEDVIVRALRAVPLRAGGRQGKSGRTGADLVAAMQASPWKEIELEHPRPVMPVRDVVL